MSLSLETRAQAQARAMKFPQNALVAIYRDLFRFVVPRGFLQSLENQTSVQQAMRDWPMGHWPMLEKRLRTHYKRLLDKIAEQESKARGFVRKAKQPNQFFDRNVEDFLDRAVGTRIREIGESERARIEQIIREAVASNGRVTRENLKRISQTVGLTTYQLQQIDALDTAKGQERKIKQLQSMRAKTIARTEANMVRNQGLLQSWRESGIQNPQKEWVAFPDERISDICEDLNGQIVPIDSMFSSDEGEFAAPPAHPNCLLPGTRVGARPIGGFMAWYDGPIRQIITKRGRRLAVTGNHPVGTPDGFVASNLLRQGDYVIGDSGNVGIPRTTGFANKQNTPPSIDQVFRSLAVFGRTSRTTASDHDLHGDAIFGQGDIYIVKTERELLNTVWDKFRDLRFIVPYMRLQTHSGFSAFGFGIDGIGAPFSSNPCISQLPRNPLWVLSNILPLLNLRLGSSAYLNSVFDEPSTDNASTDPCLSSQLLKGHSRFVELDKIEEIRNGYFRGHVYDLETIPGHYIAEGIYVSNCRSTMRLVL